MIHKGITSKKPLKFWLILVFLETTFLFVRCFRPVSGLHSFRQAQTNWPIQYWLEHGFSAFNPHIPIKGVLNSTWLLEFPIFQWIVYLVGKLTHINIDYLSRITAFICAIGSSIILGSHISRITKQHPLALTGFFMMNPFFMYWSTTGLVDWMALFFGFISASNAIFFTNIKPGVKRFYTRYFFCLICAVLGALIKPVHMVFAYTLIIIISYFGNITQHKFKNTRLIIIPIILAAISNLAWIKFTSNLYNVNDSRHIWSQSAQNASWFLGSKSQYLNVVDNIAVILHRFLTSSFGIVSSCISILFIYASRKYLKVSFWISIVGILYLAIFINLNLVHQYYQIPLIFIFGALFIFGYESFKITDFYRESKSISIVVFLIIYIFSISNINSETKSYFKMIMLNKDIESICPANPEITSPILVPQTENPEFFYSCGLEAFESNFSNPADLSSFLKEKDRYKFMYLDSKNQSIDLNALKLKLHIKTIKSISDSWYRISF